MKLGKIIVSIISVIIMCTFSMVVASASAPYVVVKGSSPEKPVSGSSSNDLYKARVDYGPTLSDASKADVSYIMSKIDDSVIADYTCETTRYYKNIFGSAKIENKDYINRSIGQVYVTDSFTGKRTTSIVLRFVNSDGLQFTFDITFE